MKRLLYVACNVLTVSAIIFGGLAWGVAQVANGCPESGDDWW